MAYIPFDKLVDKVTERELVYDIIERLKLGKQMVSPSGVLYYDADTMLTDVIKKLVSMAPPDVNDDYYNIKVADIHIKAGERSGSCLFTGLLRNEVVLAYSQQTQMDIKEAIQATPNVDGFRCIFTSKVPFINDETIKVFAR